MAKLSPHPATPASAMLAFLLMLPAPAAVAATDSGNFSKLRAEALAAVNESRQEHGLATLEPTESLNKAAQRHAEDMLERDYYSHESPEGNTLRDRYLASGGSRWQVVAENIGLCTGCPLPPTEKRVRSLHQGWMDSPGHRENILKPGLQGFGFGIAAGDGKIYAVQTFAGPGRPAGLSANEEPTALSPERQTTAAVEAVNRERKNRGLTPLTASEALGGVASKLLPQDADSTRTMRRGSNPYDLLPPQRATDWRALNVLSAGCGGCGTKPTAADIRHFTERWLSDPGRGSPLLDPDVSHLGFAMRVGGDGSKVAIMVVGQRTS